MLYLIPFLHQTTTLLSLCLHIKSCILFHFYIKPQLFYAQSKSNNCCILFHFYIKPQLLALFSFGSPVVSYSISTSNHNSLIVFTLAVAVVSYSISTSNHNLPRWCALPLKLYLIPFLHQTTTVHNASYTFIELYLIPFLHQTTTL